MPKKAFSSAYLLPVVDAAFDDAEQRMRVGDLDAPEEKISLRRARAELGAQVPPFVEQLSARLPHPRLRPAARDLAVVEAVAAASRLLGDRGEERGDRGDRPCVGAEARELRMAGVSAGGAAQDLLGEQGFAPGRDEAPGVGVAR